MIPTLRWLRTSPPRPAGWLLILWTVGIGILASLDPAPVRAVQSVEDLVEQGRARYARRQYFQAIELLTRALELAGEDQKPQVRKNLASAQGALGAEYFNAGENRLAEEMFRKALGIAGNYYSHFGLGYLYFMRMEDAEALKQLQEALEYKGDFASTHKLLALLDYRQGRTAGALERIEEALRLDPQDSETRALLNRWRIESSFSSRFREVSTRSFTLRIDPEISGISRNRMLAELVRAHREVGDGLGFWPSQKTAVVLFSEKNFYQATGSYHWVGGMYDGQLKMPVPGGDLSSGKALETVREVVRHEYAHVLIRHLAPECPVWLNEGIAQHFEKKVDLDGLARRLFATRERRLPLLKVPARLWAVNDVKLARQSYLQGLGFVEFLVENFQEFRVRLLLAALAEEHSLGKAFERTFGLSLEELEKLWWKDVEERSGRLDER